MSLLSGAAIGWPLDASAQQSATPVIGFLNSGSPDQLPRVRAFQQGLREAGYIEGRNVAIEYRWADGHYDQLPALAVALVHRQVTVIVSGGTPAALAAKAATSTIPIVFQVAVDPVEVGLVASLSRPGGKVTGVTNLGVEVESKGLELMHDLVPTAIIMALLINPTNPAIANTQSREVEAAARALGLQLHVLHASTEQDFETVFSTLVQIQAGELVISADVFFASRTDQLAALSLRHAIPSIYVSREFAAAGGLISYGGSITDVYRFGGVYTGRVLRGEKPADLPIQQSTQIELIPNLKTAKALGITIPRSIMVRADEEIE
jgi:putative ABC transport system substrate-binding protein